MGSSCFETRGEEEVKSRHDSAVLRYPDVGGCAHRRIVDGLLATAAAWTAWIAVALMTTAVHADGTEMLGPPLGLTLAPGTDFLIAGVGLKDAQPGTIRLDVPPGAAVRQVILYWEGLDTVPSADTDTILVNGISVTGDRIGGPTLFFSLPVDGYTSTYRQDITNLGLIAGGTNDVAVSGLDFGFVNCGAGLMVVIDEGADSILQLRDGNDAAFFNFAPPLNTTAPVSFAFPASTAPRVAALDMFFASVALEDPSGNFGRPTVINIMVDGVIVEQLVDSLFNNDGPEWDSLSHEVIIPAGATTLTVQALSQDSGTGPFAGNLPASLVWLACGLAVESPEPESQPGWNWVDVGINLTKNQPAYWSALTGQPGPDGAALPPFTILDPSSNPLTPGRPATDGSTDRVLRGFMYAWAVDNQNREISWNHLKGDVTIVNYRDGTSWEYNAWAFQDAQDRQPGSLLDSPYGQLDLNGSEYVSGYAQLQFDFFAAGSTALSGGGGPFASAISLDTSLTLHPVQADFRQEGNGPVTTKANFVIWNEDETQLTGLHRCISCWDQTLLSFYRTAGNHFLLANLQTDKGRARIDGIAGINDCGIQAQAVSLLGVAAKHIAFASGGHFDSAGGNLVGLGTEPRDAAIRYDLVGGGGGPPTLQDPGQNQLQPVGLSRSLQPLAPPATAQLGEGDVSSARVSGSEKGSLLMFSKVEIRWDALGNVVQDTFIDISNDWPADVQVQLYFVNGDAPTGGGE